MKKAARLLALGLLIAVGVITVNVMGIRAFATESAVASGVPLHGHIKAECVVPPAEPLPAPGPGQIGIYAEVKCDWQYLYKAPLASMDEPTANCFKVMKQTLIDEIALKQTVPSTIITVPRVDAYNSWVEAHDESESCPIPIQ